MATATLLLALSGCSGTGSGGRLLLARDTSAGGSASSAVSSPAGGSTDIWAVSPGEQPSTSNRVARDVLGPLSINTVNDDGTIARDMLGTAWTDSTLLSFHNVDGESLTTVGQPGKRATTIAAGTGQMQSSLLRRGAFVATEDRCVLARSANDAERVGNGFCQISEDERWVVSWPARGGRLTIRDLRTGTVRTVSGNTTDAVALGHGASVLAVQTTDGGKHGVVLDATTGKVTGRTAVYSEMRPFPVTAGSTGFTALAAGGAGSGATTPGDAQLLWIDTSAQVQVIDDGALMMPVLTDSSVTYVRLGTAQTGSDSIRRWDSSTAQRTVLLEGRVGAAAAGPDDVIATRDTDDGVALYRSTSHGSLERVATLKADVGAGSSVGRMLTSGDSVWLQIDVGGTMALAHVDLVGDAGVPVRGWAQLNLDGVDTDGTALISGYRGVQDAKLEIGIVTPDDDRYSERMTASGTGLNLIHDGVIYATDRSDDGVLRVRSVRAQGRPDIKTLYTGHQLGGATWPTDNGATVSTFVSRVEVLKAQQAQQAQPGSTGGGSQPGSSGGGS